MTAGTLIFGDNPDQKLRIRRLFLAIGTYFFAALLAAYGIWKGLLPGLGYLQLLMGTLLPNLAFYLAIRFDFNARFNDPSLTAPQMIVGTLFNMYLLSYATEARGAFLMLYVLILVFGIFKLRPEQFILIGLLAPLTYGGLIWCQSGDTASRLNLPVEILQWLVLVFIIPWFALVGGYIGSAHRKLRDTNEQLEQALRDVSAAMKTIQEQATHDELTGVYNRRYIMGAINAEKKRADRTGERFCVLVLDIDHFKKINDRLGHLAGDHALVVFAQTITAQLRAIDCFGRFGGEEFLLLMPGTTEPGVLTGAERIRQCVEQAHFFDVPSETPVTVSIGIAEYRPQESVEEILARADRALYDAKAKGRNRVESWSSRLADVKV